MEQSYLFLLRNLFMVLGFSPSQGWKYVSTPTAKLFTCMTRICTLFWICAVFKGTLCIKPNQLGCYFSIINPTQTHTIHPNVWDSHTLRLTIRLSLSHKTITYSHGALKDSNFRFCFIRQRTIRCTKCLYAYCWRRDLNPQDFPSTWERPHHALPFEPRQQILGYCPVQNKYFIVCLTILIISHLVIFVNSI